MGNKDVSLYAIIEELLFLIEAEPIPTTHQWYLVELARRKRDLGELDNRIAFDILLDICESLLLLRERQTNDALQRLTRAQDRLTGSALSSAYQVKVQAERLADIIGAPQSQVEQTLVDVLTLFSSCIVDQDVRIERPEDILFDVFLCHNSAEKPTIRRIARKLESERLKPWLDEEQILGGRPWQRALEQQISLIRTVAVFIGSAGNTDWMTLEEEAAVREFLRRKCPVIPVILKSAPPKTTLPLFLGGFQWIDFREQVPNPFTQLVRAIRAG